jgi:hypothetical protein
MSIGIPAGGEEKRVHHGEHGGARREEGTGDWALGQEKCVCGGAEGAENAEICRTQRTQRVGEEDGGKL